MLNVLNGAPALFRPPEPPSDGSSRGRVVLFYPPYDGEPLGAPLCLFSLAGVLRSSGFTPVVIDAAIEPNYLRRMLTESADAICVGISMITGPMINGAIEVAAAIKHALPHIPIIFGGWHPTLTPEQTLEAPFVDVVVRGQGEITLLELALAYASNNSIDHITGINFKRGDERIRNADRRVQPIDSFAPPAYDLMEFDAYEPLNGHRKLAYTTSVGCPYACNYCTDMVVYNRRFNAYSAERVVEEMIGLVSRYRIDQVNLFDSNFPVDLKRAMAIARGIIASGVKFQWTFQASTDFICRMSQEDVQLLADSGLILIGFGTESTSEKVLKLMNKRHQRVDEMFETARRTGLASIRINFNLIFGYPGETEADRVITFQTMSEIGRHHRNVRFSPNIFTPYPGIPIWAELRERGVREPQSLQEWADMPLGTNVLPWLKGRELARFNRMLDFFLLQAQMRSPLARRTLWGRLTKVVVTIPLAIRMKLNFYLFPWELWFSALTERIIMRRSLITGKELPVLAGKEAASA